jgi:hypothetical protein
MTMGGKLKTSLVCRPFFLSNYKINKGENQLQIRINHKG